MKVFIPHYDQNPFIKQQKLELKKHGILINHKRELTPRIKSICSLLSSDILHIQWPEHILTPGVSYASTKFYSIRINLRKAILSFYKLLGGKIIWTVHNLEPHGEKQKKRFSEIINFLSKHLDGWISLTNVGSIEIQKRYPKFKNIPHVVIPHPEYRTCYPNDHKVRESKISLNISPNSKVFLFFGNISTYKNVPSLVSEFLKHKDNQTILIIAGKTYNSEIRDKILSLIKNNNRIRFDDEWISDSKVQTYFNAADVTIIPYRDNLNSGVAFLSLSFNKPICCPNTPTFIELKEEVGSKWIHLYEGAFNHEAFEKCLKDMPNAEDKPDLSKFEWSLIALKLADFYKKTLNYTPNFK
jgi:beta-1,4-mannosyltransferase